MELAEPPTRTQALRPDERLHDVGARGRTAAAGDLVRVVAVDREQRVALLSRNSRPTLPSDSAEGEPTLQTATRLLLEHTGLAPGHLRHLGVIVPPRGAAAGRTHLLLAVGLPPRGGIPGEVEDVVWQPLSEALAAVRAGHIGDAASRTGLLLAALTLSHVLDGGRA